MELAWLFGEARARQRRRRHRLIWAAVLLLSCALAIRVVAGRSGPAGAGSDPQAPGPRAVFVSPSAVFAQAPYMGVRCPIPNSIACDRVGLAVWLRRPARSVRGTIAGEPLRLDWFGDQRRIGELPARSEVDGYLQPAHISTVLGVHPSSGGMWYGGDNATWPSPLVKLSITFAGGQHVITELHVALNTGWG